MALSRAHIPQRAFATGGLFFWISGYTSILFSARWVALESIPVRLYATSSGPFRCPSMILPHRAVRTSLLPFLHWGQRDHAPGRHNDNYSLPSHCIRRFRSTAASWVHR
jgi:hypothetical protein